MACCTFEEMEMNMKTLYAYAVINETSNTDILKKVAADYQHLSISFLTNTETAVEAMNTQFFQLLIIDEALPGADIKKLHRLAELLHPDAAIVELHTLNEDYVRYKLSGLMLKWEEAQAEGKVNFIDNPGL